MKQTSLDNILWTVQTQLEEQVLKSLEKILHNNTEKVLAFSVMLHGVHGNMHFGAQVSAPTFATVMGSALGHLNIPPDTQA